MINPSNLGLLNTGHKGPIKNKFKGFKLYKKRLESHLKQNHLSIYSQIVSKYFC